MIKLALCEDDRMILEQMQTIIEENFSDIQVYAYDNLKALDRKRDEKEFDLYLLDIELGEESGFDYAKSIRQTNKVCKIAFITSHDEYSIEGYDYGINGYLLKPFDDADLIGLVDRLKADLKEAKNFITIMENYWAIPLEIGDIDYLKVQGRKTHIITCQDIFETNESLTSILERISSKDIFKISRSTAINVLNIKKIGSSELGYQLIFDNNSLDIDKRSMKKILTYKEGLEL